MRGFYKEESMSDYLVRAAAADDYVRAFAVTSGGVTEEARKRHHLSPVASAALGRTMAAALMMGEDLKNDDDYLTIQFEGDGPLGGITVTADALGGVKGYVGNPDVVLPPNAYGHFDVGGAVGHGFLRIMKDIGLKEPYSGSVEIQTGEIAQDLTYYYAVSEQVPSVVALGVLTDPIAEYHGQEYHVRESGGYIIQLMPDCPEEIITKLEQRCTKPEHSVTEMLRNGKNPEDMLEAVLGDMGLHFFEKKPVRFFCNCSKERYTKALIAMGPKQLADLIRDGKPVTLTCGFCNNKYTFEVPELEQILTDSMRQRTGKQ